MKEIKITICPYCGGSKFTYGYGVHAISTARASGAWPNSGKLRYTVCRECGSVVHIQAIELERLPK